MTQILISVPVTLGKTTTPEAAVALVDQLIRAGLTEMATIIEDGGNATPEDLQRAYEMTSLTIGAATAEDRLALVTVRGGVAEVIEGPGVAVEVFDWDDFEDEEPENQKGVPVAFSSLAAEAGVPVAQD